MNTFLSVVLMAGAVLLFYLIWRYKDPLKEFAISIIKEMEKVTWPSREELMESTKIVILVTLIIAVFTYFVDLAVQEILKAIL